ncbi:hypothetical protein PPYR_13645 [Photinus pyralis]|uniref:Ig-like domain-containing protein n=1 Tax=Photinus pyralis TaxID=7054 RepID=A0A5N4A9M6_PHOPY|nr:uncharacterized protein LOC116179527 [Photinus pyralis]KAB0794025.1 hypothetical protein PPYR_13645 [Photinus pyralis]
MFLRPCLFVPGSLALRDVKLTIPAAVERGKQAKLHCNYDMEGEPLYAVKWYKSDREFFRYTPLDSPPYKQFVTPYVNVVRNLSNGSFVVLDNVAIETSGKYSCEISADAPSFFTIDAFGLLQVVEVPKEGPIIKGLKSRYRLNDTLKAECTSIKSPPAANLTWFVNDFQVDPVHLRRNRAHPSPDGFYSPRLGLRLLITKQLFVNGRLRIRCLASMHDIYTKSSEVSVEIEKPKFRYKTTPMPIFQWEDAQPAERYPHTTLVFAPSTNNNDPDTGSSLHPKLLLVYFPMLLAISCVFR